MLSVYSTLEETLFLWVKNFWYLVALSLIVGTPIVFLSHFGLDQHSALRHSTGLPRLVALISSICSLVLMAFNPAAILGLMRRQTLGTTVVSAVFGNIKKYTWTLFRLQILIAFTAIIMLIPLVAIGRMLAVLQVILPLKMYSIFGVGLALVLLKYALADPLIVVENFGAWNALKRSWVMTKGHFWYVAGCYLFLGAGNWILNWLFSALLKDTDSGLNWLWLSTHLGLRLFDSLWIILSWCIYLRIKKTDEPALPAATVS